MSKELEKSIYAVLQQIRFPGMSRDIVSFGFVDRVTASEGAAKVRLVITTHRQDAAEQVRDRVREALEAMPELERVEVELAVNAPPPAAGQQAVSREPELIPEVRHVVAVASGKGGVGKSTVAANLAARMAQLGYRVGLLDADIYGPSVPMLFGLSGAPKVEGNRMVPFEKYGVRVMSLGFILDVDTPVIWRGPMVMKAIEQMLGDVDWGPLDYLIVDLPPGTGDAQLTISQKVPLSGVVIVTTPQDLALIDARKGLAMFRKVNVPVVGIVENMSAFVCPHCGETTEIFKKGGGERTAELLECAFLGSVPLDPAFVAGGDSGVPVVVDSPDGAHAGAFEKLVEAVVAEVGRQTQAEISIV